MSTKAQAVLDEFRGLPRQEQIAVYEVIARSMSPDDYEPLSDDDLTTIAAGTFSLLDEEESRARQRRCLARGGWCARLAGTLLQ